MSKRASVSGKAAASPAKKARVEADPLLVACQPVFKVLKASSDASTAEMLCSALPLAMKVAEGAEKRHAFQERLLAAVEKELSTAVTSQKETVDALEKKVADLEAEKAQSTAIEEDIASRLVEKQKECDATGEAMKTQQEALNTAQSLLEVAKKNAEAADGERQELEKTRDDFTNAQTDLWQPLKTSEPQTHWRVRDKKLAHLADKFQKIGVERSLLVAVQVALKIKEDTRGEFAQAAIAHAEEVYAKHVEVLKERVDHFGGEISARATATAEAEANAKAAQEALDAAYEASCTAQNTWADETNKEVAHKATMEAYGPTAEKLQKKVAWAHGELARLEKVSGDFDSLRSGKPSAAEEAAAAAVSEMAEEPAVAETTTEN